MRNLLHMARSRKDRRRLAARNRKPIRLRLESLEDRLTPSGNPTLLQTAGSYNALTAALASDTAANTNYVIQITNSFTFNSGGQVTISKLGSGSTLTIEGQNGTNHTLTGNGNRLFTVASGQKVTFENLTLTGGSGVNSGGAILDQGGNVTLSKVDVENNTVRGSFFAAGGGVYASGASTLVIRDSVLSGNHAVGSRGANGTVMARNGGQGASAYGGGLYVFGGGWSVTLIGDTLWGNTVIGGAGGDGAAGSHATGNNAQGGQGGSGGGGGDALGGAAYFGFSNPVQDPPGGSIPHPSGQLTILDDSGAPITDPSLMIDNSVQAGNGGKGAIGGTSTGTAHNANGGSGGRAGSAGGGAVYISSSPVGGTFTTDIGNTTFFGNTVSGGNGGAGGAAGTGGSGAAGTHGGNAASGFTAGGGVSIDFSGGTLTMVNSTLAKNTLTAGLNGDGTRGGVEGGGLFETDNATVILDNNTITQNILNGTANTGSGIAVAHGQPLLHNNLIQGNQSLGSSAPELSSPTTLNNASNNFITSTSPNAVNPSTNIVGNTQVQLGNVVGDPAGMGQVLSSIYYPLLSGSVSIGAGTTSVLGTIAGVERTTAANATDEIGNSRSSNGPINLGAVQTVASVSSYPLILTYYPASQTVFAGGPVSFTISASGNPMPMVQWQVSTNGGNTWANITGATSTTLTLDNITVAMNGNEYQAVITNSSGSETSAAATLTVNPAPPPPPPSPPLPPSPTTTTTMTLNVPPLLAVIESLFGGGTETVNADGTETIIDSFFGIPLIVSTFGSDGNLMSVDLFGFFDITFLFV
jgi:hypothetical protein